MAAEFNLNAGQRISIYVKCERLFVDRFEFRHVRYSQHGVLNVVVITCIINQIYLKIT